jgi:uncharacterized membrane protein
MQGQIDFDVAPSLTLPVSQAKASTGKRVLPVDALRGVALLLMAFHHTAIFIGTYPGASTYNNLPYATEAFPHWLISLLTHIAAPTFWLLGGVSIALFVYSRRQRGVPEWEITRFLLIRGALIVIVDLTLGSLLWPDAIGNTHVLISLGISIAIISVLRLLPINVLALLIVTLLAAYQLTLSWIAPYLGAPHNFWIGLWFTNSLERFPGIEFPVLGWITIMLLVYILGNQLFTPLFSKPQIWISLGILLLSLWLTLRWIGGYGDINPYIHGSPWYFFFDMSKSPPSLTYQAFYIGLAMLLMATLYVKAGWLNSTVGRWLVTIGQVPLFFFVFHPLVYRPLAYFVSFLNLDLPLMLQAGMIWATGLGVLIPLSTRYRYIRKKFPDSILKYL